ncbi:hypothetical protein PHLCEN_2v4732 [Hermanssonia centrifuga]|uniref:Uncharacterized protein n=1 Tax=Hermanssonia centrifuga TaxID=98765 RepID=A0A2R6PJ60_9APHY|nr:hypothetical protein PHLCEN_2v4732 [Hermanssonia centrifuga]
MASRWSRRAEDGRPGSSTSHRATAPGSVMSAPDSTTGSSTRGSRAKHPSSEHLSALSPWIEPPPLDDNCARYILSVMVIFLKQAAPLHQRLMSAANLNFDASYHDLESIESIESSTYMDIFHTGPVAPPSIGSYYASSEPRAKLLMRSEPAEAPSVRTSSHFAQHTISYERTSAVISSSMTALHTLIAKFAGRVVYHLSASNWAVVFTRIKNNIYKLAGTNETDMDVMDVRLMTHCWLDRARLVQLLQELQSLFVNMKQEAQIAIAGPLRTAIWNWIENHQEEFNDALLHHRRLEGAPERVFDSLYRLVDVSDKAAIWPVLTVLMCISSDRIKAEYQMNSMGVPRGPHGRKDRSFAELLTRTLINPGKSSEVPVICALDVCRAASRIQPSEGDGELPLQSMATDVAHEIKMILAKWDGTQKPFWECPEEIDVALVADALVTVFRFLAEDESLPLFKQCLQPEMSDAVKISALKACITLITESTRISWQKPLDNLKSSIMQRLYGVFHSSITRRAEFDSGILKKANFRPKAKRYTTETLPDRELALHATLALWRSDVHWFLDGLNMANEPYWIAQTLEQWAAPADSSVRLAIARTIRYIQEGLRSTPVGSDVWQAGSAWVMHCGTGTMASIGMSLLHCRTDFESQRMWMHMCHELLYRFTRSTSENQTLIQFTPERAPAFAIAEIALLVTLTSADRVVSATASHCLRLIAAAERQKGGAPTHLISDEEKGKRYPVYEQLGNAKALVLGRVADQKRIRKLVRLIAMPSPSNIAVWEECYWRWCNLNALAGRSSMDPSSDGRRPNGDKSLTTEERQAQWQNLTLFLTSFSASCLGETHDPAALAAIIPARYLPDQLRVLRDPADLLSDFLTDLINLLLAESGQARDVAREALSTEAHPRLYPRILKQLEQVMLTVTAHDSVEWEQLAIFLDQFTAIVKVIVENVQSGEDMRGIDITSTLLTVASYISRFNDTASYRLKVKFCSLCDSFLDQSESFSVRRDNGTRIGIADCIIEWAQEPSVLNDSDLVRAQREINAATLRTAVKLFERLELQLTDEEGQVGEDSSHTVSRLFMRYSSFLFKTFTRTENGLPDDGMSEQTTFSQTRAGGKDGDIRELIINGLASLISANPEYGIKHCLPMTFDADPALRVVFAHVFARVVSKGLKFDPQEAQPPANKQSRLCESALALAICEVCPPGDVDQIINVLLNMFNTRSSLMNLLKAMIDREISRTGAPPYACVTKD